MDRTRQRAVALAATTLAAAVALGLASAPAGAGGGDWIEPARDRYEAGQTVTMIGYGMAVPGLRDRDPFYAWLRVDPVAVEAAIALDPDLTIHPSDVRVGRLLIEDVPGAVDPYRAQRASITFDLPDDLAAGVYPIVLCNDPCTEAPGYFMADALHVGIDPPYPIVRSWPLDEPAIRWLEDDALLSLDGRQVTAAEVRAGTVRPPAPPVIPVPAAPPSTVAPIAPRVAASPDPAGVGGTAGTAAAEARGTGTRSAPTGDGGAAAWWVAAEVAALVGGGIAAMAWVGRRRRRGGGSAPPSTRLVIRTGEGPGGPGRAADPDDAAVDGLRDTTPDRPDGAVSIRL